MNVLLLKQLSILSAILGAGLGLLTVIPFVGNFTFLFTMALVGAAIIVYMKKMTMVGFLEPKDGAVYGGIAGFISFVGFCATFLPLAAIIGYFAKTSYYMGISLLVRSGVFVVLLMIIFIAMLSALMNAFSGMAAAYIYSQIDKKPEDEFTNFEIEE